MSVIAENIGFAYHSAPILRNVGFGLGRSEILGIIGPNGSGKTTLLKCINRILAPSQGHVVIDSMDISKLKRMEIAKRISYVPQNSNAHQDSPSVFEFVMMGRNPHSKFFSGKRDEEEIWKILKMLNIERYASAKYNELSGGEKQKVMIARALAQEARVMLLDEPTSNLDIKHQIEVMDLLKGLVRERGISACAVVHDLDLSMKYCDKVVLMEKGKVFASGDTKSVITPENIRSVYGVDVVIDSTYGRPHVVIV